MTSVFGLIVSILFALMVFLPGCQTLPPTPGGDPNSAGPTPTPKPQAVATPSADPASAPLVKLSWEVEYPENHPWSVAIYKHVGDHLQNLDRAQDIDTFCPRYRQLNEAQKKTAWSELFSAMAFYESSWDAGTADVDVGKVSDRNTWSVGLLQLSQTDQESYGIPMGWSYNDFLVPDKNLQFGVLLMDQQITKRGKILIAGGEEGLYWACIHPGGQYDSTRKIQAMVKHLSFCN